MSKANLENFKQVGQSITFNINGTVRKACIMGFGHNFDGSMDFDVNVKTVCEISKRQSLQKITVNSNDVLKFH